MNRVAVAIAGAAIAVAAFMVGRATVPNAPVPVAHRAARIVVPGKPALVPPDDALRECETKLAFAQGVLHAQEHAKIGDPVPFPEDLPLQYTPAGFEDAVRDAMRLCPDSGLHLARVDCSEYPCMAFFTQPEHAWNHALDDLRGCDAWRDRFGKGGGQGNSSFMTDGGIVEYSMVSVATVDPDANWFDHDENASTRWTNRYEQGKEALMAELGGREFTPLEQIDQQIDFWKTVGNEELLPDLLAQRARLVADPDP